MPAESVDDFEELFPGALQAVGEAFPPPPAGLVERGIGRGRRMRRARCLRLSAMAVSLAGVVVGGAVAGTHVLGGTKAQPAVVTVSRTPLANATTSAPAGITSAWMISTLEGLLPGGGTFTDATGRGTEPGMGEALAPFAAVVFHNGVGASEVDISLSRIAAGTPVTATAYSSCPAPEDSPYAVCTTHMQPDGSLLVLIKGFTRPQTNTGQRSWSATLIRTDGFVIEVTEFGAGAEKSTTSSVDPLLSTQQLAALGQSTAWQPALALIKPPARATATPSGYMARAKVMATLTGLLPHGVKVSAPWGQDGFGELVVDDGRGKSAVELNVQHMAGLAMDCTGARAVAGGSCSASMLPDGTKMVVTQGPYSSAAGSVTQWMVDTLRPDGLRVVVFEFNAASSSGPVTRPTPGLTIAQLQQIVTSAQWEQ